MHSEAASLSQAQESWLACNAAIAEVHLRRRSTALKGFNQRPNEVHQLILL